MRSIRALIIAEDANPEWTSVPLVGWSHTKALAELVDIHLVTQVRNRDAITTAGWVEGRDFTAIDSEPVARPLYRVSTAIVPQSKAWTATLVSRIPGYLYFEHLLWKQFGDRIRAGEFDLVHRITPVSPTIPSPIAVHCRGAGVPFVWGPINGGVPWPHGFHRARRRELEWLSYVREVYKLVPGYRSTRKNASAIVVGSRITEEQLISRARDKVVYLPENAVSSHLFDVGIDRSVTMPLQVGFVGRLVPLKGTDMLIEACAPLVREGKMILQIFGDGPEMSRLRNMIVRLRVSIGVRLHGWVAHNELQQRLQECHVFCFPSIREFGGAVVLEAMALGVVPVVVDYGGPGELVASGTGYKVPIGTRECVILGFRQILSDLIERPHEIRSIGDRARSHVMKHFTWQAKAKQMVQIYDWVLGRANKPSFFAEGGNTI